MKLEIHPTTDPGPHPIDSYIVFGKVCAVAQSLHKELHLARANLSRSRMCLVRDATEAKLQGIKFLRESEDVKLEQFLIPSNWDSDPLKAHGFFMKIKARLGTVIIQDPVKGIFSD